MTSPAVAIDSFDTQGVFQEWVDVRWLLERLNQLDEEKLGKTLKFNMAHLKMAPKGTGSFILVKPPVPFSGKVSVKLWGCNMCDSFVVEKEPVNKCQQF